MIRFSVLQSVYKEDNPSSFDMSLASICNQTLLPNEVVLVRDGIVSSEISEVIEKYKTLLPLIVVGYEVNKGLAFALNYGLEFVTSEYVARMDSDDIAVSHRFETQLKLMERHPVIALCSSYINEFKNELTDTVSVRKVPLKYENIKNYLKKRNAFNHMAVCFKKSAVINSGGYQEVPYFEDYDLWVRMIIKGYKACNIPDILVNARIGNDMIGRRHGFSYARHELFFIKRQLKRKYISKGEYLKLIFMRIPVRLFPKNILKLVYKIIRVN